MTLARAFQAVESGNLRMLSQVMQSGADPNATDEGGRRLLTVAVSKGRHSIVEHLLAHGADPDATDGSGQAAAAFCSNASRSPKRRRQQPLIARALLNAGTRHGAELKLWLAVLNDDLGGVDAMLREGAAADPPRLHVLADAAAAGRLAIVERLLDAGAELERMRGTRTPLLEAAYGGHLAVVQRMVACGAEPLPEGAEEDAAYAALQGRRWSVVTWLENKTKRIARRRVRAEVERGPGPERWLARIGVLANEENGSYALICVRAPIEEVAPAARDEVGGDRLLIGLDREPQWLLRNERLRFLTQVQGCEWTILAIPGEDFRKVGIVSRHLAQSLSEYGWSVLFTAEDKYTEEDEIELFRRRQCQHRTSDFSIFHAERVHLPTIDAEVDHGVTIGGLDGHELVRVDAITVVPANECTTGMLALHSRRS